MKNRFIFVGNQLKKWILREPFYDIINGKYENAVWVDPYIFPDAATEKAYFISFRNKTDPSVYENAKWSVYSVFRNLEIQEDEHVFIVFLYGRDINRLYTPILLRRLKEKFGEKISNILMLLDSIDVTPEKNGWYKVTGIFGEFDQVITFDKTDAQKYGLELTVTPYARREVEPSDEKSDLYFCGDEKNRGELLFSIAQNAVKNDLKVLFKVAHYDLENKENIIPLEKYLSYEEVLKEELSSNCLVEILSEGQSSPSLRYYEAVIYNKKLLTNNPNIAQMPVYDPRFMKYFKDVSDIDFDWIRNPAEADYKYNDEFSVKSLLDKITENFVPKELKQISATPKVSVVLPTYNREKTILRAVNSVLNQTYTNLELIIVDDGSKDDTLELLKTVTDPRVKVISQTNQGACAARNHGLENCTGEYIAFQDSDDFWHENKLEEQMRIIYENICVDVVFCNGDRYSVDGEEKPLVAESVLQDGIVSRYDLQAFSKVSTQTILARKECFELIKFDPEMPRLQDYDLVIRLAEWFSFYYISESLVTLYEQDDSISVNPQKSIKARLRLLDKYPEIMSGNLKMFETTIGSIRKNLSLLGIVDGRTEIECAVVNQLKKAQKGAGGATFSKEKVIVKQVTCGWDGIMVRWKKLSGAATYNVYRRTLNSDETVSEWIKIASGLKDLFFYDKEAVSGCNYEYHVKGFAKSAFGGTKSCFYLMPPQISVENGVGCVNLCWNAVKGAAGYYIFRKDTRDGNWIFVGGSRGTSFSDKGTKAALENGTVYYYTVKSYVGEEKSISGPARNTIYLKNVFVSGLTFSPEGTLKVTVSQNDKATGYEIQYSMDPSMVNAETVKLTTVSGQISGLERDRVCYVRTRCYKTIGSYTFYSAWSAVKSVQ